MQVLEPCEALCPAPLYLYSVLSAIILDDATEYVYLSIWMFKSGVRRQSSS